MQNLYISQSEREYIRELAKRQLEYANLPVMKERRELWYLHNSLKGYRPVIVMEMDTFERDMLPVAKCISPAAIELEVNLLRHIINYEMINDDKVVPAYYTIYWKINLDEFGIDIPAEYAKDSEGRSLGYALKHPFKELKKDLSKVRPSKYSVDREGTMAWKAFVEEIIGDIMPVRIKNDSLHWYVVPSSKVERLMGLENMMYSIVDEPEEMHSLYRFIRDDILSFVRWQEAEGLLVLNNENDYVGAGSYGFTTELPAKAHESRNFTTAKDLWLNMNSQETVGISPFMFGEFIFPYYYDLAKEFGMVYFGCCEPVHNLWDAYISRIPGLRKVSVSPWCDEKFMGQVLKNSGVIYSRKPSPNTIGVGKQLDEENFSRHMEETLRAAAGCSLELIFRDVYTLSGDVSKPGRAVKIVRELIDNIW